MPRCGSALSQIPGTPGTKFDYAHEASIVGPGTSLLIFEERWFDDGSRDRHACDGNAAENDFERPQDTRAEAYRFCVRRSDRSSSREMLRRGRTGSSTSMHRHHSAKQGARIGLLRECVAVFIRPLERRCSLKGGRLSTTEPRTFTLVGVGRTHAERPSNSAAQTCRRRLPFILASSLNLCLRCWKSAPLAPDMNSKSSDSRLGDSFRIKSKH